MKYLISLFFIMVTTLASAEAVRQHVVIVPTSPHVLADTECKINNTQVFMAIDPSLLEINEIAIATESVGGTKLILVSPFPVAVLKPKALEFIVYHECGHHKLGHLDDKAKYQRVGSTMMAEKEADCYAVNRFVNKYGKRELMKTVDLLAPIHINHELRKARILSCL